MFVVRVQNDEAVMYRAFRRVQSAQAWASDRSAEELDCLVDVMDVPDTDDLREAVVRAKSGHVERVVEAEALTIPPASVIQATDIKFGREGLRR